MIQPETPASTSKSRGITLQKIVQYCTYYRRDYHIEDKCHNKYPHLKKTKLATAKPDTKRRRIGKPVKNEQADNNLDKDFYLLKSELESFMTISANLFFSKLLI